MDFISAIKTGRPFKRKDWTDFYKSRDPRAFICAEDGGTLLLSAEDVLADDWEVEEEKKELSWRDIHAALDNVRMSGPTTLATIKSTLGFKE